MSKEEHLTEIGEWDEVALRDFQKEIERSGPVALGYVISVDYSEGKENTRMDFINKPTDPDTGGSGAKPVDPQGPTLQEQISALQTKLGGINEQIAGLKFEAETIDSQIADLKNQLADAR